MKQIVLGIVLSGMCLLAAVDMTTTPTQWLGTAGQETGTITLKNNTSIQRQIDGVRATFDSASIAMAAPASGVKSITAVNDGNGAFRFDVQVLPTIIGITPTNFLQAGGSYTLPITTSSVPDSVDWTPKHPQILVLGGKSLAEKKPNEDIAGITLAELDSIIKDPSTRFHDSTLFVLDTLGIRGSAWGCGFIDTWVDQTTKKPIWQIQVNEIPFVDSTVSPPDTFRFWNENKAFLPDSLDVNDPQYGPSKRPFYLMGLAMTQEYMNIDMQSLMGKGFQESNAGLSMGYSKETPGYSDTIYDTIQVPVGQPREWTWSIQTSVLLGETVSYLGSYYKALFAAPAMAPTTAPSWDGKVYWQSTTYSPSGAMRDSIFVDTVVWRPSSYEIAFQNVKYTNRSANGATSMGPMHYEEATFGDQIYDAYPKFFPYDATKPNSGKYIDAPTGGSPLNHPSIVNAYLISSLNMWYAWQLIVASLGETALDQMKNATNRRLMGDMVNYAWNQGVYGNYKDAFQAGGINFIYIDQINNGINHLEKANRNSVLNGGDRKVYDSPIDRATMEEFFFGQGGNGSAGTLGSSGLLHHFNLDVATRQKLWREVDSAFTLLKGKAPSTLGTQNVSYRYDYLALLRIAKKFLDLSIPVPKTDKFDNWTTDPAAQSIDNIAPYLAQSDKGVGNVVGATFHKEFKVSDTANMPDSAGIRGVSWTMSSNWTGWMDATNLGGGRFDIAADKYYINTTLPVGVDTIVAWVKVTDVNDNELIDTFTVWRNEDSVIITTGPEIVSATKLVSSSLSAKDTVTLVVSENLSPAAEAGGAIFRISQGSTREVTAEAVILSGTSVRVIFPAGTVMKGDSISFATTGSIASASGNKPLNDNPKRAITVLSNRDPLISSAQMFDVTGDGYADSLHITLTLSGAADRYDASDITGLSAEWPISTVITGATIVVRDSATIVITGFNATSVSTSGMVRGVLPSGDSLSGIIVDNVGPALRSTAVVNAQDGARSNDTLIVKVTEALQNSFQSNHVYLAFSTDSGVTVNDEVASVAVQYHYVDSVVVIMPKDFTSTQNYTWVRLVSSGGVQDAAGNTPASNSIWVPMTVQGGRTPVVVEAALFDMSAPRDGSGDHVKVRLSLSTKPNFFTADSILSAEVTWNGTTETATIAVIDDSAISLLVADGAFAGTSGSGSITLHFPSGTTVTSAMADSIAPVLLSATYAPGETNAVGVLIDTLILLFSEPLTSMPGLPASLEYTNQYMGLYTLPFDSLQVTSPTTVRFFTTITESSISPADGDSIRLVAGVTSVSDGLNNQTETTAWVRMTVNPYSVNYKAFVYPNPLNMSVQKDNSAFFASLGYVPTSGSATALAVRPASNRQLQGTMAGAVKIYDPLGHLVFEDVEMTFVASSRALVTEFNGLNLRGRELTAGMYRAVFVIEGASEPLFVNIGVSYGERP